MIYISIQKYVKNYYVQKVIRWRVFFCKLIFNWDKRYATKLEIETQPFQIISNKKDKIFLHETTLKAISLCLMFALKNFKN